MTNGEEIQTMNYDIYLSPFTWRYGSIEMRTIWSEVNKRKLWRKLWVTLAETQVEFGLVKKEQVDDLQQHMQEINMERALEIEAEIHHDLMAELKTFAEQAPLGGGILHLGATSMDIEDNADVLRTRQSLELVLSKLADLLKIITHKVVEWADLPIMAFTHIQPAEPSTLGYRLGQYAQDLFTDWSTLNWIKRSLQGKGFKGAVGTSASYAELIGVSKLSEFENHLSQRLELPFFMVTTQVYPRKQDYQVASALAGLGGSLYKFAFDLRLLQSPPLGEMSEPFSKKQVGSSAMPFKRNPIHAEKINSLARMLAQMPRTAWDNAAHSLLERTLDDSANRRTVLPESFLIVDELLITAKRIMAGLQINQNAIRANLRIYGPFAAVERVLMASVKAGADRQAIHERLRNHAITAWETIQQGKENPLLALICHDEMISALLTEEEIRSLMDATHHLGDAPQRARLLAEKILSSLA
jgi:adenylosuccinate lyase